MEEARAWCAAVPLNSRTSLSAFQLEDQGVGPHRHRSAEYELEQAPSRLLLVRYVSVCVPPLRRPFAIARSGRRDDR